MIPSCQRETSFTPQDNHDDLTNVIVISENRTEEVQHFRRVTNSIFQTLSQISFAFIIIDSFVCILGSMSLVLQGYSNLAHLFSSDQLSQPPVASEKGRLRRSGVNNKAILPCTKSEMRNVIPLLVNCCDKVIIIPETCDKTNTQKKDAERQGNGDGLSISTRSGLSLPL